jgi:hypothetical protein
MYKKLAACASHSTRVMGEWFRRITEDNHQWRFIVIQQWAKFQFQIFVFLGPGEEGTTYYKKGVEKASK